MNSHQLESTLSVINAALDAAKFSDFAAGYDNLDRELSRLVKRYLELHAPAYHTAIISALIRAVEAAGQDTGGQFANLAYLSCQAGFILARSQSQNQSAIKARLDALMKDRLEQQAEIDRLSAELVQLKKARETDGELPF